jgi:hypothetical protein
MEPAEFKKKYGPTSASPRRKAPDFDATLMMMAVEGIDMDTAAFRLRSKSSLHIEYLVLVKNNLKNQVGELQAQLAGRRKRK